MLNIEHDHWKWLNKNIKKIYLNILFSLFLTGCQIQNPFAPEPISLLTDPELQTDSQTNDSNSQSIDNDL